jgi:hypothetical protein
MINKISHLFGSAKKIKLFLLACIFAVGIASSMLFADPSDAVMGEYKQWVKMGLIDGVLSPKELGLEYLGKPPEPAVLAIDSRLRDALYEADAEMSQQTDNISLAIPINNPANFTLPQDTGSIANGSRTLEVDGVVSRKDRVPVAAPITPSFARNMYANELRNNGTVQNDGISDTSRVLFADASGSFLQARKLVVFDLFVVDKKNRSKRYLVPRVVADTFCRDLIVSARERTYRRLS